MSSGLSSVTPLLAFLPSFKTHGSHGYRLDCGRSSFGAASEQS
jgi:hypothetical protein